MKNYTKLNIKDIIVEEAHGGSGSRQILVKPEHVSSQYFEAITKGFLKPGNAFDWHTHENVDEIFIVLKGEGRFYCENEVVDYNEDDVIAVPGNLKHKIEAGGKSINEYYFIRIKAK